MPTEHEGRHPDDRASSAAVGASVAGPVLVVLLTVPSPLRANGKHWWKLLSYGVGDHRVLFNITGDPGEKTNLALKHPEVAKKLQ